MTPPNSSFKPFRMEIDHYSEGGTMRRCRIRSFTQMATPLLLISSAISVVRWSSSLCHLPSVSNRADSPLYRGQSKSLPRQMCATRGDTNELAWL
jgi:hypothetical protein